MPNGKSVSDSNSRDEWMCLISGSHYFHRILPIILSCLIPVLIWIFKTFSQTAYLNVHFLPIYAFKSILFMFKPLEIQSNLVPKTANLKVNTYIHTMCLKAQKNAVAWLTLIAASCMICSRKEGIPRSLCFHYLPLYILCVQCLPFAKVRLKVTESVICYWKNKHK